MSKATVGGNMNHNRRPIPSKARKKMEKEVKKGQTLLNLTEKQHKSDKITPEQILKKYRPKFRKQERTILEKIKKKMATKKKKISSKRTTPGELLTRDSTPKSIHIEGTRWKKTLAIQNKTHRKELTAKLLKRRGKK